MLQCKLLCFYKIQKYLRFLKSHWELRFFSFLGLPSLFFRTQVLSIEMESRMMQSYHLWFWRVGFIFDFSIWWVFMGSLWWVYLYGRPYVKAKKKSIFLVGWPFCKGPSRRVGIVLTKQECTKWFWKNMAISNCLLWRCKTLAIRISRCSNTFSVRNNWMCLNISSQLHVLLQLCYICSSWLSLGCELRKWNNFSNKVASKTSCEIQRTLRLLEIK
jgi:hypothetical protein